MRAFSIASHRIADVRQARASLRNHLDALGDEVVWDQIGQYERLGAELRAIEDQAIQLAGEHQVGSALQLLANGR